MNSKTTYYRPSTAEDAKRLAPLLRESDVVELRDSTRQTPMEALELGLELSDIAYTLFSHGDPVCMGGVAASGYNKDVGIAWFLASDKLTRSASALQRYLPAILEEMHGLYHSLANFVDVRNTTSIAWLRRLGFNLVGTVDSYGVAGIPFHWFVKGKHVCVPLAPP